MFDFQRFPTFTWPVVVQTPQLDGTVKEETFTATWQEQDTTVVTAAQAVHPKGAAYCLLELALKSWDGISVDGAPWPCTAENWAIAISSNRLGGALVRSYWDAVNGKLREKN